VHFAPVAVKKELTAKGAKSCTKFAKYNQCRVQYDRVLCVLCGYFCGYFFNRKVHKEHKASSHRSRDYNPGTTAKKILWRFVPGSVFSVGRFILCVPLQSPIVDTLRWTGTIRHALKESRIPMPLILKNEEIAPNIFEMVVEHPRLAKKVKPGHFVIVMSEEDGERIPLTAADFDAEAGTITLIAMAVGTSTKKLVRLTKGDTLFALMGPLGHPSEIENYGTVIMTAGGVGTAPIYPIARALKNHGNRVVTIQGSRNKDLLFWQDKMVAVSDEYIVTTDDGTAGHKALVTGPLREILESRSEEIGCVYLIGPTIMMKFCAATIAPFNVKGIASLNSIMIDGTGMCGVCRVQIGDETKFTCVDGPEFDAKAVHWDALLARQKMYCDEEQCSYRQYLAAVQA